MSNTILVVDDNATNIQLLGGFLRDQGYKTLFALDGKSGMDVARKSPVDLILLDVMMPGMNGLEVCTALKSDEATKAIPIILLTALDQIADVVQGFSAGCSDYVTKPFRQDELLARIRTHLELGRLRNHLEAEILQRTQELQNELEERKHAEEALHVQVRRVRDLEKALDEHALITITDNAGKITYVNDKFCTQSKFSRDELLGKDHSKDFTDHIWQKISQGNPWKGEIRNRAKDGTCYWTDTTIVPFLDKEGKPYQHVAIRTDITERKKAEEALEMSHMKSDTALQLTKAGHWHVPVDGSGWYNSSARAVAIFGDIPNPDLRYRIVEDWFTNVIAGDEECAKSTWQNYQDALAGTVDVYDSIYAYKRPIDGRVVWIHALGKPVRDEKGVATDIYGVTQDISDFIEAENVIRQLNQNLEQRVVERTQELMETTKQLVDSSRKAGMAEMAIGVLHNIGNALTGINIKVQNLSESYQIDDPIELMLDALKMLRDQGAMLGSFLIEDPRGQKILPFLEAIVAELRAQNESHKTTLYQLIKDLGDVTQVVMKQQSHAKFTGTIENVALAECLEDVVSLQTYEMQKHAIKIVRDFQPTPLIPIDRHKLLQILSNIVRNAMQATFANQGEKRLTLKIFRERDQVGISVQDNGVGMSAEQSSMVFRYGFTTKKSGHGFGLHTSSIDAKLLGGSLSCHSDGLGYGSSFTLTLPLVSPHREQTSA